MKKTNILRATVVALATLALTSCNDWLTLYPQEKLTEETFWEDMNDLNGVRYSAYRGLAKSSVVDKLLMWGELRSDNLNFTGFQQATNFATLSRVNNALLDTASSWYDWAEFYTVINRCNQVLANGDKVLARDPQFSDIQWRRIRGEMIALRSLSYFYLVRAFGNVPYVNTVIKNDAQIVYHKQSLQADILDSLIRDVDAIKDDVRLSYRTASETRSLITQPFTYALLADMCLWRGAKYEGKGEDVKADEYYYRAYKYAVDGRQLMDDPVKGQYKDFYGQDKRSDYAEYYGKYTLLQNFDRNASAETFPTFDAYKALFNKGASDEVIFELPFTLADEQTCGAINSYFGKQYSTLSTPYLSNYEGLLVCCPKSNETKYPHDLRLVYTCTYANTAAYVTKQGSSSDEQEVMVNMSQLFKFYDMKELGITRKEDGTAEEKKNLIYTLKFESTGYRNFIVYRKSDLIFAEAEAVALLTKLGGAHAGTGSLDDIRYAISEHRRRNAPQWTAAGASPIVGDFMADVETAKNNIDKLYKILMDEKQIEFVGEAKRWFDIVRFMERIPGDNAAKSEAIRSKIFGEGLAAGSMYKNIERSKRYVSTLRYRWAFYNPVYYPEREASHWLLYQNPCWDDDSNNDDPASFEPDGSGVEPTPETPTTDETVEPQEPATPDTPAEGESGNTPAEGE
ncbi:MAG: RagB/SusD family nutrient uptake outer membrane protein [Bacteroidaceae bacterium]|nr:RagB/SusD family nutrient uptake outer membrane protein [Bacteroidaceae bacterium]